MTTPKQLTIVPDEELKLLEVPPTAPESWVRPKVKPLFPGAIKKILYKAEIEHLSDKQGARHVDKPMEYVLWSKVVKICSGHSSGINLRGNAFILLQYVFEQGFIPELHFGSVQSIATGYDKNTEAVLYVQVRDKGRQTVLVSKLIAPWY